MRMLKERGVNSVIIPDITENLLTQPNWITAEQRRETAAITARRNARWNSGCRVEYQNRKDLGMG